MRGLFEGLRSEVARVLLLLLLSCHLLGSCGSIRLTLLLHLLWVLHGPIGIGCWGLLPVVGVYLVVGLGNHRNGSRPASLATCRGLLLGGGVDEGGHAPGRQVGQLHCQLGVLYDGIGQVLLLP